MFEKERESFRRQGKWAWFLFVPLFCIGSYCVCGIGAALTIPAFINYTRGSKAAEASANLATLSAAMEAACAGEAGGMMPRGFLPSAGPIPLAPREDRQTFVPGGSFVDLQFSPEPVYYSYSIVTPIGSDRSTILAEGDLDGDGVRSRYTVECRVTSGLCDCDAEPTVQHALE